ncbi:MAG: hypothetical protein GF307_07760 [candidate division Zixibacteria bacterium]|nr:hypothetical protein [candidate division Zixibacteria bacterium]
MKKMRITCNDSTNQNPMISVKAIAGIPNSDFKVEPDMFDVNEVLIGEKEVLKSTITNIDTTESELQIVDNPFPDIIKVDIDKKVLKPDESTEVAFTVDTEAFGLGKMGKSVTFQAKNKYGSRFTIPIEIKVVNKLSEARD